MSQLWIVLASVGLIIALIVAVVILARRAAALRSQQSVEDKIDASNKEVATALDGLAADDHYAIVARLRERADRRVRRADPADHP